MSGDKDASTDGCSIVAARVAGQTSREAVDRQSRSRRRASLPPARSSKDADSLQCDRERVAAEGREV